MIGFGIALITQFIAGVVSLDGLIIIIIMIAFVITMLIGGRIEDAPNALIGFMKSTLDINDSNINL
jgi:hypothetical protein